MAAIWFTPENTTGRLESPTVDNSSGNEGFYGKRDFSFHALLQVDSRQKATKIPLLRIYSDVGNPQGTTYKMLIWIELGKIKVEGYDYTRKVACRGYSELSIPFDELFELVVTFNPSKSSDQEKVVIKINGVSQTVQHIWGRSTMYTFNRYSRVILGGDGTDLGNAKGLLVVNATLTNTYNTSATPVASSNSDTLTVWRWDFEDRSNPLKIITSRNNKSSELQWTNTDATNVVWTDTNSPPSSGSSGGIIIPGNGNTTRIQGTVMEDDQPVARRVFAITQALLEIDGSQKTQHAVLNSVLSDSSNGSYSLDTSPYEGAVFVMAVDDYGQVWQASTAYEVGHVIRPANFQGYVYHCTVAGTGDSTEPNWWFDDSVKAIGTAQFKAKPYTRPLAHGPVIPEIVPES